MFKPGHRQTAIEEYKTGVVFKVTIGGPFHADELGGEHREPSFAENYHGMRVGHRVCGIFCLRRWNSGL
jgi:hypothetical protein